jgi:YggT family protein
VATYLIQFVNILVNILLIAIVARALMSWFPMPSQDSPFFLIRQMINQITDPIIEPIRRIMPSMGMLDLSPMVAMILLIVIRSILVAVL